MSSTDPASARVAIVLVNWNGWRECIECMDSVLAQAHRNFHLFIVDNASQDLSVERIIEWCSAPRAHVEWRRQAGVDRYTDRSPGISVLHRLANRVDHALQPSVDGCEVTLIRSGGNLGFAGGCNVGITAAVADRFYFFLFVKLVTLCGRGGFGEL